MVSAVLCVLLASLDPAWCGHVLCYLSLVHMHADTCAHIRVIGRALLFSWSLWPFLRTKGAQVYVSLILPCAVSALTCSFILFDLVVCHVGEIIIVLLYFLGHDIREHPWWCRVYSRPTLLWEGLWWYLKSNEATVCMSDSGAWYMQHEMDTLSMDLGYAIHNHWAFWTPCNCTWWILMNI